MPSKFAAVVSALTLAGCATTSFGPGTPADPTVTSQDLAGGIAYVDTFIVLYRDRANELANGRQWFEVPAFLGIFGGAVASAGGASDGGLVGAGIASLANAGNTYYSPKERAALFRQASDAMSCVQLVGAGLTAFEPTQKSMLVASAGDDATLFLQMRSAAWAIERILAERLSNTGALPDAAGLAAEYEKLAAERQTAEREAAARAGTTAETSLAAQNPNRAQIEAARTLNTAALTKALQFHADLQLCVLRMKS